MKLRNILSQKTSLFTGIILSIILISGCAKYKPKPLKTSHGSPVREHNVTICTHQLSKSECRHYFSRRITDKGYQPIQVSIINNSNETYILDASNIGLQIESWHTVAQACHIGTGRRFVSWFIPALFVSPFLISALVDASKASKANTQLNTDFNQRSISLESKIYIHPQTRINKVFFVAIENFYPDFDIILVKKDNPKESLTFELSL